MSFKKQNNTKFIFLFGKQIHLKRYYRIYLRENLVPRNLQGKLPKHWVERFGGKLYWQEIWRENLESDFVV